MACLPTYNGKRYASLEELNDVLNPKGNQPPIINVEPTINSVPEGQDVKPTPEAKPTKEELKARVKAKRNSKMRLASALSYVMADIDKEMAYIKARTPFPLVILDRLIEAGNGLFSWGQYQEGIIKLHLYMEEGTGYHEMFHGVFDVFTNNKEKNRLYREFAAREGSFKDYATGQVIAYADATPLQAEEQMAEEYREFVMTGQRPPLSKKGNFILELLKRILAFFNSVFTGEIKGLNDFFSKMDSGKYKNVPFKSIYSTDPRNRLKTIGNLGIKDTHSVVKHAVGDIIRGLFEEDNLKAILEGDLSEKSVSKMFAEIREEILYFLEEEAPLEMKEAGMPQDQIDNVLTPIRNGVDTDWNTVVELSVEMLKTFNIDTDTSSLEDAETNGKEGDESNYAAKSSDSYLHDMFTLDGKLTAPAAMKLLISTIQESLYVGADGKPISNLDEYEGEPHFDTVRDQSTRLTTMVEYGKAFNKVLATLHNYNTLDEKLEALKNLGKNQEEVKNANYMKLYNRLTGGENARGSMDEWYLKILAFNTFSKQRVPAMALYMEEDGMSHFGDLNTFRATKQLTDNWLGLRKSDSGTTEKPNGKLVVFESKVGEEGRYLLDATALHPLKSRDDLFSFLDSMSIHFDNGQQSRMTEAEAKTLFEEAHQIYHKLTTPDVGDVKSGYKTYKVAHTVTDKGLGIKTHLGKVFDVFVKTSQLEPESTYLGVERKPKQEFVQINGLSKINNDINNSSTLDELMEKISRFSMPIVEASQYLKKWFDHKNSNEKVSLAYVDGVIDNVRRERNTSAKALSRGQRLLVSINANINKYFYALIPADSSTEWMVKLDHLTQYGDPIENTINQAYQYYLSEKKMFAKDGRGRVFSSIEGLGDYTATKAKFTSIFRKFIQQEVDDQFQLLLNENILVEDSEELGIFRWNGLDNAFARKHNLITDEKTSVSLEEVRKILQFRTSNFILNNMEIQLLYFGDYADYSDPVKRYKSFMSPTEASMYGDPNFNRTANSFHNTMPSLGLVLEQGDPEFSFYNDILRTVTSSNVETYSDLPGYEKNDSTDAQARCVLSSYKQMLVRAGRWNDGDIETQYQFCMAQDRLLMEQDGLFSYKGMYKSKGRELKLRDMEIVAAGNPHKATYPPIKPIVTGMDENGEVILDKLSISPMTYAMVRKTNLASQYKRHLDNGISYEIFKSGRKVMSRDYEMDSMYNADGTINTAPYKTRAIVDINYRWFGIQVETQGDKDSQTVGSQMSAMASMNLLDNGVPVAFLASHPTEQEARDKWSLMTDSEKRKASKEYDIIKTEQEFREMMIEEGYQTLLKKLGATDTGTDIVITEKDQVVSLLQSELSRRQISQNLKDGLSLNERHEFTLALEALPNYEQLKSILFSNIEKHISKQKVGGAAHIQQSSTGFETAGNREYREVVDKEGKKKTYYACKGLKFYTKGEPWMEIMLPCWFAKKLRSAGLNMTDDELITYLNNTDEGKSILKGIGFRIPTQDMNSMDSVRIKAFTPEEMGQTVIVPEELTTKSGSDFDVDKLNMYLKNVYVDNDGKIKLVTYKGSEEATKVFYDKEFDKIHQTRQRKNARYLYALNKAMEEFEGTKEEREALQTQIDDAEKDKQRLHDPVIVAARREDFVSKRYRESLENEYFNTVTQLLELPQNFERITKPNSKDELKAISEELEAISATEFGEGARKSILSPSYMNTTRHNFIASKSGVAIAATAQKNTAVMQKGQVVVIPKTTLTDPLEILYLGDGQVLLPSNGVVDPVTKVLRPTLSGVLDKDGRLITTKVSQYLDGFVDSVKDTFLLKMGISLKNVNVALILEKLGVPNSPKTESRGEHAIVSYFLNQPILKEYMKILDAENTRNPFHDNNLADIRNRFPVDEKDVIPTSYPDFSKKADPIAALSDFLKSNISNYYGSSKKSIDNKFQHFILNEFLKYSVIANNQFRYIQATNHDTAFLSNPNEIIRKEYLTADLENNNILVNQQTNNTLAPEQKNNTILDNNFVGLIKDRAEQLAEMIRRDVFTFISPDVAAFYMPVFEDYLKKNLPAEKFFSIARKIEQSFITFLTQNGGDIPLNSRIHELMINAETSLSTRLALIKDDMQDTENSEWNNNIVIKELITDDIVSKERSTKIVKFLSRARDPFSSDIYTEALYEIRSQNRALYNDIITVGFIQSGVEKNPISFMDIVPVDDYAQILSASFLSLASPEVAEAFVSNNVFYRMAWKNLDAVRVLRRSSKKTITYFNHYKGTAVERMLQSSNPNADFSDWITYTVDSTDRNAQEKFLVYRRNLPGLSDSEVRTRKNQGLPFEERVLLQRVDENDGTPFVQFYKEGEPEAFVTYVPVNAWGDGIKGQEAYVDNRPSIYDNGTYKVPSEFSNNEMIAALRGLRNPQVESFVNQQPTVIEMTDKEVFLQMGKKNIQKILNGTKTTSLRSPNQFTEIGLAPGQSGIATFEGKKFRVTNRGLLSISEAGGQAAMLKSEGVETVEELKFEQSVRWMQGKNRLYVYDIAPMETLQPSQPVQIPGEFVYQDVGRIRTQYPKTIVLEDGNTVSVYALAALKKLQSSKAEEREVSILDPKYKKYQGTSIGEFIDQYFINDDLMEWFEKYPQDAEKFMETWLQLESDDMYNYAIEVLEANKQVIDLAQMSLFEEFRDSLESKCD